MSTALVIIAIVVAVTVVATGGILSVKPVYAIDPVFGGCTGDVCPGATGFTPAAAAHTGESPPPANEAAPGHSSLPANEAIPGIAFRSNTIP